MPLTRPTFTDFYRFLGLSWETSPLNNYHPEASRHSGSGRIEFSSKNATFLMSVLHHPAVIVDPAARGPMFADFSGFLGRLRPLKNYHPEGSERSGSGRILSFFWKVKPKNLVRGVHYLGPPVPFSFPDSRDLLKVLRDFLGREREGGVPRGSSRTLGDPP